MLSEAEGQQLAKYTHYVGPVHGRLCPKAHPNQKKGQPTDENMSEMSY